MSDMNRLQRANMAKFRTGTYPINIEKGRHKNLPVEERTCHFCPNMVEDELHFLLVCPAYADIRNELLEEFRHRTDEILNDYNLQEQFYLLMNINKIAKKVAYYLDEAFKHRQNLLRVG